MALLKAWAAAAALAATGSSSLPVVEPAPAARGDHRLGHGTTLQQSGQLPDVTPYPVRGVDVSHYEGDIDWARVAGAGVDFAYIKATEGESFVDDMFAANWSSAAAAGIARGAYHFYDFCETGAAQARAFSAVVPRDAAALPPVLDLERSNDCATMPPRAAFLKDLADYAAAMRAAYGRDPILYVNADIVDRYFTGAPVPYLLWVADPFHAAPQVPDGLAWAFWQYSWNGTVAGIASGVDLDAYALGAADLRRLAGPGTY